MRAETSAYLANEQIDRRFNPPSSPHFGGLWEAGVKSIKLDIVKTIGTSLLSVKELFTLLVQIKAILNSGPLTPISNDITDEKAVTPGYFLTGHSLVAIP